MWSGFTKDSLPIGTEIDVDGYLATTAERPAAMSRFRMEESCVWHRPVPMLWTRKNDRWAASYRWQAGEHFRRARGVDSGNGLERAKMLHLNS
jgi:hypothetical protein